MRFYGITGIACVGLIFLPMIDRCFAIQNATVETTVQQTTVQQTTVQQTTVASSGVNPALPAGQPAGLNRNGVPPAPAAVQAPPSANDQVRNLIELMLVTTWDRSSGNRDEAAREFIAAQSAILSSPEAMLSYTVNRMQHYQYDDALSMVRLLNDAQPANVEAAVLRIWLEAVKDNYEEALVAVKSLRSAIDDPAIVPSIRDSAISRCGKLIGYMQGPVNDSVNPDSLETVLRDFLRDLDPDDVTLFNEQRERVLEQHQLLIDETNTFLADEEQRILVEDRAEADGLINDNQSLEFRTSQLTPQIEQLRSEQQEQIAAERALGAPLERELANITGRLNAIVNDITIVSSRLLYVRANPEIHLFSDELFLANQLAALRFERSNLISSANSISNQLVAINNRIAQLQLDYGGQINSLQNELSSVGDEMRRNRRRLTRLAGGPRVAEGKVESRRRRLHALPTYFEFPLELYRAELVDRFLN
ncbi:MAG: hypothetical protein AAF456_12665 [Planctomycetota bacterium]